MSKTSVNRIRKAIEAREKAQARIDKIRGRYQPKIDRLTVAMNAKTSRWVAAVRFADTTILAQIYTLSGGELSRLRRQFPGVRELGVGAHAKKEIA